jgi:hypothetical protein
MSATDGGAAADGSDTEPSLDSIIKPGVTLRRTSKPAISHALAGRVDHLMGKRLGWEEFGLEPVVTESGEADLAALTAALQAYVADQMIPVSRIHDLNILVETKFLAELPAPPPGMKYVWDNRLQVSVTVNN